MPRSPATQRAARRDRSPNGKLPLMKVFFLGCCLLAAAAEIPSFEQYKVANKFAGKPATPILRTRLQRNFRSMIVEAAEKGPNFAGHYTLAEWGCGAGCMSMAIVDNATGRTFDGPFNILGYDLSNT